jgi:pyruvate kinase
MRLGDRRAKIVATIGPATSSRENLEKAIRAGMNVARLNFSHGSHADHAEVIRHIRYLSRELKAPVAILQDLQGPKIRVGRFADGRIPLEPGQSVTMTTEDIVGQPGLIPTDFKELPHACKPGTRILLDDGLIELRVDSVKGARIQATVVYGGELKDRKGINVPGAELPVEALTKKDLDDLEFGLKSSVDFVALSFVRRGSDMVRLRELTDDIRPQTRLIAKIEMLEALANLEEIVQQSDGVMVARGDLAIEAGQTQLPHTQKRIIRLCNKLGKPVITATQMLDSMVENPRPTRAEITDVANAVIDGSDALMLSAESASGKYPFKCIRTMHDIISEVERSGDLPYYDIGLNEEFTEIPRAIAASACLTALKLQATAIVCLTTTGKTATMISNFRPKARVIAVIPDYESLSQLQLCWGLQSITIRGYNSSEEAMRQIEELLLGYGLVQKGDRIVMTLGLPVQERAKTNSLRVYCVGHERPIVEDDEIPLRFATLGPESF